MIIAAFSFLILVTGVPAMFRGEFLLGLSGTVAPFMAMASGGGISANLRTKSHPMITTILTGGVLLGVSLYWIYTSGWNVRFWSVEISGIFWILIAFSIGWLFERSEKY